MAVSVNMPNRQPAVDPLEKLLNAVNVAKSIYGINAESQTLDLAKQKFQDEQNSPTSKYKDQVATRAMTSDTALNDPNSQETQQARQLAHATLGAWAKTKTFAPDAKGNGPLSALSASIDTMTGAQINKSLGSESPLFKTVAGVNATEEKTALAAAFAGARSNNLNERQNQNSVQAGHAWEADPIIKTAKTNLNSLKRSESILNNTDKPLQSNDLNLAYTDYINAVAAGGAATEGKIHRELPPSFEVEWEALKQKVGANGDLRSTDQGKKLIQILHQNINQVKTDLVESAALQSEALAENYVGNTNPKVQQVVDQKRKSYSREALGGKFNNSGAPAAPGAPAKPKTVIQNGHTYNLNEQTGQYE